MTIKNDLPVSMFSAVLLLTVVTVAFDAEMYAMSEAMKIADEMAGEKKVRRVMVFTDSQATLRHQQKIFPTGRNGSVRVDALHPRRQRHPGGR